MSSDLNIATKSSTTFQDFVNTLVTSSNPAAVPIVVQSFSASKSDLSTEIYRSSPPTGVPTSVPVEAEHNTKLLLLCTLSLIMASIIAVAGTWMSDWTTVTSQAYETNRVSIQNDSEAAADFEIEKEFLTARNIIATSVPCINVNVRDISNKMQPPRAFLVAIHELLLQIVSVIRRHRWFGCLYFMAESSRILPVIKLSLISSVSLFSSCMLVYFTADVIRAPVNTVELYFVGYHLVYCSFLVIIGIFVALVIVPLVDYSFSWCVNNEELFLGGRKDRVSPHKDGLSAPTVGLRSAHWLPVPETSQLRQREARSKLDALIEHQMSVLDRQMSYDDYIRSESVPGKVQESVAPESPASSIVAFTRQLQDSVTECRNGLLSLARPSTIRSLDQLILNFDRAWGLDIDGTFSDVVADEEDEDVYSEGVRQSSLERLILDMFGIQHALNSEMGRRFFALSEEDLLSIRRRRLVQMFLLDTLPHLSAEIVRNQVLRSEQRITPYDEWFGWLQLTGMCIVLVIIGGSLAGSFLLGTLLSNIEQRATVTLFLFWLAMEVGVISTAAVVVKHFIIPRFARKNVIKVMKWLVNAIYKTMDLGANRSGETYIHGEVSESAVPSWVNFDAAQHFFLSRRLAMQFSETFPEKAAIISFRTLWPRQMYSDRSAVTSIGTFSSFRTPAQWMQGPFMHSEKGALGYVVYGASMILLQYLALPLALQDVIVDMLCWMFVLGLIYIHYWLFVFGTPYVVIPFCVFVLLMVCGRYVHFQYSFEDGRWVSLKRALWLMPKRVVSVASPNRSVQVAPLDSFTDAPPAEFRSSAEQAVGRNTELEGAPTVLGAHELERADTVQDTARLVAARALEIKYARISKSYSHILVPSVDEVPSPITTQLEAVEEPVHVHVGVEESTSALMPAELDGPESSPIVVDEFMSTVYVPMNGESPRGDGERQDVDMSQGINRQKVDDAQDIGPLQTEIGFDERSEDFTVIEESVLLSGANAPIEHVETTEETENQPNDDSADANSSLSIAERIDVSPARLPPIRKTVISSVNQWLAITRELDAAAAEPTSGGASVGTSAVGSTTPARPRTSTADFLESVNRASFRDESHVVPSNASARVPLMSYRTVSLVMSSDSEDDEQRIKSLRRSKLEGTSATPRNKQNKEQTTAIDLPEEGEDVRSATAGAVDSSGRSKLGHLNDGLEMSRTLNSSHSSKFPSLPRSAPLNRAVSIAMSSDSDAEDEIIATARSEHMQIAAPLTQKRLPSLKLSGHRESLQAAEISSMSSRFADLPPDEPNIGLN